ncbi:MAG TPA: aminotransferase class I/II-fold pyridoxal phosphate-dependent enzyme [Acidobacteriota bacterium]|nr:aminotransferase class I/II-fold pyridoxal phosphate-dependent enzyme [Acidobacteriota bacterium]
MEENRDSRPARVSAKAASFSESVIREMTRLAARHSALNLAQGFPNFAAPQEIKDAACRAIQQDINQYAVTWGSPRLRQALAEKYRRFYDWDVDPDRHITVACGATECMIAAILAVVDPGQKVMVIEPFYENYGPDTILAGAAPVYISLDPQRDWALDFEEMESVLKRESDSGAAVRALILNTPHNPTGKVFSRQELERIAQLACQYDFYVITDEIYEHIVYDGHQHFPIALMEGMADRTITVSGMSKSYSVTGWRIGTIIAAPDLSDAIRKVHDFLTVGAAAPLQEAGVAAMNLPDAYYRQLADDYRQRRDYLLPALEEAGFRFRTPYGAYYVMTDISAITEQDDVSFVRRMITEFRLAAVPGSSFFHHKPLGSRYVRFAFCKTLDLLAEAAERIAKIGASR